MWSNFFAGSGLCGWGPGIGSGHLFFGWLFPVLFWGIVIYLLVKLIKNATDKNQTMVQKDSAIEVLKKRYAAGEISRQEFESMKATISS